MTTAHETDDAQRVRDSPTDAVRSGTTPSAQPPVPGVREAGGAHPDNSGVGPELAKSLGLDEQLCFALYAANNAVVRAYRPLLQAVGLSYPQYVVLMALWEDEGIGMADLGLRVKMSPNDLSVLLDDLGRAELVEQHRHRFSRRVMKIALTDRGRLVEERAVLAQHQIRCQTKLSAAAVEQLRESLHDLTDTLEGPPPRRAA